MTNSVEDLKEAEVIIVTGSNTTETHPVIGMWLRHLARYKGVNLIVVDPRKIDLTEEAVMWLAPKTRARCSVVKWNGQCDYF